jgi:hypothetical protein
MWFPYGLPRFSNVWAGFTWGPGGVSAPQQNDSLSNNSAYLPNKSWHQL